MRRLRTIRTTAAARDFGLALLLVAGVIVNGIGWSHRIPPDGAPDEPDHYALVRAVAGTGRLPVYGEGPFVAGLVGRGRRVLVDANNRRGLGRLQVQPEPVELRITYLFVPQTPYFVSGWLCRLSGGARPATARFASTMWIALGALALFLAGRAARPDRVFGAWVAAAAFALWPQVTFVGAYVNDDAFALAVAACFVAACVWCETGALTRRRAAGLGAATGLLFAAKPYVLVLVPLGALWLLRRRRRASVPAGAGRSSGRLLLLGAGVALAIALPGWVRNAVLYDGDPTGQAYMRAHVREFVESLPNGILAEHKKLFLKAPAARPKAADFTGAWLRDSMQSFWARFGWMNVRPPRGYVESGLAFVAVMVLAAYGVKRRRVLDGAAAWLSLPVFVLLLAASVWNSYAMDYQPQGRYLLAAVPGTMVLITSAADSARNAAVRRALLAAILLFFLVQNILLRVHVLR